MTERPAIAVAGGHRRIDRDGFEGRHQPCSAAPARDRQVAAG